MSAPGASPMSAAPHSAGEVVSPESCTHLTGRDHVASLTAALAALLADDDRRAAYGAAGVRRARGRYRWSRVVADTEAVYRQVLARSPLVEVAR